MEKALRRPSWFSWIVAVLLPLQFLPMPWGLNRQDNPPVVLEPAWVSPEVRALAVRACFDCHSNETAWPWYRSVAPVRWLVSHDVHEGRRHLNFSDRRVPSRHADDAAGEVREGEMPPAIYTPLHSASKLSAKERTKLADAFATMFGEAKTAH